MELLHVCIIFCVFLIIMALLIALTSPVPQEPFASAPLPLPLQELASMNEYLRAISDDVGTIRNMVLTMGENATGPAEPTDNLEGRISGSEYNGYTLPIEPSRISGSVGSRK